jgi:hypothetical protein
VRGHLLTAHSESWERFGMKGDPLEGIENFSFLRDISFRKTHFFDDEDKLTKKAKKVIQGK